MKVIKYAQSTFMFCNSSDKRLLIDPGKYNFGQAFSYTSFDRVDVLVITHKHEDHFDEKAIAAITKAHSPFLITNSEIAEALNRIGVQAHIGKVGDLIKKEGFSLELIKTDHVVRDEPILNFGVLIESEGVRIYYTSDTRLMESTVLPAARLNKPDLLCVPISNRGVVMGMDDALFFSDQFAPRMIIPMHYDSPKDKDRVHPQHFIDRRQQLAGALPNAARAQIKILGFGESLDLKGLE
jgi:L-ascorbate metabolism protein UlaG (beta-lactamase superfamily)